MLRMSLLLMLPLGVVNDCDEVASVGHLSLVVDVAVFFALDLEAFLQVIIAVVLAPLLL